MKEIIKILEEAKISEDETLKRFIIITILLIVIDISHLFLHFHYPDWVRFIYTSLFLICYYVLTNRHFRKKRLEREAMEKAKKEKEILDRKIENYFKIVKPALENLNAAEKMILMQFYTEKSLTINVLPTKLCQSPLEIITAINTNLCMLGLNIQILTQYPHLVVQIDEVFYDLLVKYFNN